MFLQNESSTMEGWKDILNRTAEEVGKEFKLVANDSDKYKLLWGIYNEVSRQFTQAEMETAGLYGKAMQEYIASILNDSDYSNYNAEELAELIINQVDAVQSDNKYGFEELDNELMEELQEYNEENDDNLTLAEYKRGILNGNITSKNNLFFGARKLQ